MVAVAAAWHGILLLEVVLSTEARHREVVVGRTAGRKSYAAVVDGVVDPADLAAADVVLLLQIGVAGMEASSSGDVVAVEEAQARSISSSALIGRTAHADCA